MFYSPLAQWYTHIFPDQGKIDFLLPQFNDHHRLLDIGCSDGSVALGLAEHGHNMYAIDLDEGMVEAAGQLVNKKGLDHRMQVGAMNMLHLTKHLQMASFDGAFCIGNTLVHLTNTGDIRKALGEFMAILRPGGKLLIQILDYDALLKYRPAQLPLIKNDHVQFERYYEYGHSLNEDQGLVKFTTHLTLAHSGEEHIGQAFLYPLTARELESLLVQEGFDHIVYYTQYDLSQKPMLEPPLQEPLANRPIGPYGFAPMLIVVATKK